MSSAFTGRGGLLVLAHGTLSKRSANPACRFSFGLDKRQARGLWSADCRLWIATSLQYTQNRDTRAIRLKLDEFLPASEGARPR